MLESISFGRRIQAKSPYPCGYQAIIPIAAIDLKQTIVQFTEKLQCPQCGTIGGQAMPRWPDRGGGPGSRKGWLIGWCEMRLTPLPTKEDIDANGSL